MPHSSTWLSQYTVLQSDIEECSLSGDLGVTRRADVMCQFHPSTCFTVREVYVSVLPIICRPSGDYFQNRRKDLLDLFFNPLLALLILFLECEIFDLGTASTIGGSSSSKDARPGMERYHAGVLNVERSIVDEGRDDRRND